MWQTLRSFLCPRKGLVDTVQHSARGVNAVAERLAAGLELSRGQSRWRSVDLGLLAEQVIKK